MIFGLHLLNQMHDLRGKLILFIHFSPGLNTLANHALLNHNGKRISKAKLVSVLVNIMKLSENFASILADTAMKLGYQEEDGTDYFDLDALQAHNEV
jgi:hypothetical protein